MRRTTIGLAVAAALLVASAADAAQLDARLERRQLAPGETVNLLLRLRGGTERPELDVLTRDFDILKVTRSMRTSIVNNRVDSSLDWTVTLAPRGTGELEIPEIRAGDAVSAPIALQVAESPAALQVAESPSALDVAKGASALDVAKGASALDVAKGASALDVAKGASALDAAKGASALDAATQARGAVFLDAEVDDSEPYVQSRVLLTVRLHSDGSLIDGEIHSPTVEDAVVERIGEDRTYRREIGGHAYQVVERQFAIFPQRSGEIYVPPVVFDGRVREARQSRRRDPFDGFLGSSFFDDFSAGFGAPSSLFDSFLGGGGKPVRMVSAAATLDVKARPAGASGQWWLPARNVELIEDWERDVPVFRVGEPIERSVAIRATGLSGAQLPELDLPEIEGMKQYGEPAVDETAMVGDEVVSVKLQRTALIPTRPGAVTLPAVELAWWDTQTDTARTATLPARSVEVLPGDEELAAPLPAVPPTAPNVVSEPTQARNAANFPHLWRFGAWVGAGLGILILLTMAGLPRARRHWAPLQLVKEGGRGPLENLRRAEASLRRACRNSDRAAAVTALRQVARARWPEAAGLGPAAWAARLDAPELERVIEEVHRAVYAEREGEWQGAELWRIYRGALRATRRKRREPEAPLPALYPTR